MSKQSNTEFRRKKKQDPLRIVLACSQAYCKDITKKIFFFKIRGNMIKRCTNKKKMKNKKYRNVKIFSSDII